ncbi:hypothetical protein Acr_15g0006430 [Actinidia rufa]|uniref:BUD13 homolog n=1 Tax=Actinidia rufa TaxID=165716 RepID=A0A7J0FTY5_9ERIC|nr:hypothetical protein Acr_15g0006430 [Actinidia rufa]
MVAATSSASGSLKEYLKRYESKNEEEKKKKKKKKRAKPDALGVLVVDEDPVWQKPVQLDEDENDDSADEEKPLVDEDIEVKRMKRLEQLRLRRPFGAISEDGSGWVPVSDTPTPLNSNEQNSDISPPRKRRIWNDTSSPEPDLKSSRGGREVTDLSPPRQVRRRHPTPSPEPETKSSHSLGLGPKHGNSNNQSSDISPPRKQRASIFYSTSSPETEMHDPDFSPRQESSHYGGKNSEISESRDISPPRRVRRSSLHQDVSHVSRRADLSPPRKVSGLSFPKNIRKESSSLKEQPKTGLITGQDIKEENARTKKTDWARFKYMDPSVSGQGAEPVYRDKATGARISKDELMKLTKKDEKPKEIKLEWGKGLAQKREAETKQLELEIEKDKPFARTRDDPELDRMLKDRLRWGDPMAHLRKNSEHVLPDLGENEKMKESGFIIPQDIPSHSWLKRGLDAAPNRYGIKPGRHWDGVDRSNGFEKQMFKRTNEKQATEREAYLWSVSDM